MDLPLLLISDVPSIHFARLLSYHAQLHGGEVLYGRHYTISDKAKFELFSGNTTMFDHEIKVNYNYHILIQVPKLTFRRLHIIAGFLFSLLTN